MGAGPSGTPGPSSSMYRRATVPRSTSCIPARKKVAAAMSAKKPMLRVPARTSASPIARQVLEYHIVLQGRWRDDHLSTRPNISESHSGTSTRVPHCITGFCLLVAGHGSYGNGSTSYSPNSTIWKVNAAGEARVVVLAAGGIVDGRGPSSRRGRPHRRCSSRTRCSCGLPRAGRNL